MPSLCALLEQHNFPVGSVLVEGFLSLDKTSVIMRIALVIIGSIMELGMAFSLVKPRIKRQVGRFDR
tara:strand:- start:177 stop:377 length:201 start_codon:yes stop_codon:yes gene_type:complete